MEDCRNREWTVPALEEVGASNAPNQLGRRTPSYEELVKLFGIW